MYDLSECGIRPKNKEIRQLDVSYFRIDAPEKNPVVGHITAVCSASGGVTTDSTIMPPYGAGAPQFSARHTFTRNNDRYLIKWDSQPQHLFGGMEYETVTSYQGHIAGFWITATVNGASEEWGIWGGVVIEYVSGAIYKMPISQFWGDPHEDWPMYRPVTIDFDNLFFDDNGVSRKLPPIGIESVSFEVVPVVSGDNGDPITTENGLVYISCDNDHDRPTAPLLKRWAVNPSTMPTQDGTGSLVVSFEKMRHFPLYRILEDLGQIGRGREIILEIDGGLWANIRSENMDTTYDPTAGPWCNSTVKQWAQDVFIQLDDLKSVYTDGIPYTTVGIEIAPSIFGDWSFGNGNVAEGWVQRDTAGEPARIIQNVGNATGVWLDWAEPQIEPLLVGISNEIWGYMEQNPSWSQYSGTFGLGVSSWQYQTGATHTDRGNICLYRAGTVTAYETETGELVPTPYLGDVDNITQTDIDANADFFAWLNNKLGTVTNAIVAGMQNGTSRNGHLRLHGFHVFNTNIPALPLLNLSTANWTPANLPAIIIDADEYVFENDMDAVRGVFDLEAVLGFPSGNATFGFYAGRVYDNAERFRWKYIDNATDISLDEYGLHETLLRFDTAEMIRDGFLWLGVGVVSKLGFVCGGCNG